LIGNGDKSWVILVAPTQSGKTVFLQVAVADSIDQDPGTLLYLLPDKNSVDKMIKERIIDVIEATPELAKHKTGKAKDMAKKGIVLDNMTIYPAWSGSLASMSSTPCKRVILDEVRLMKLTIGEESNAFKLANDRLTTYAHYKVGQGFAVSSPSSEGDLLHQQLQVEGTTVLWWWSKCPHCGKYQLLKFKNHIRFNKETGKATCNCEACGGEFSDYDKKRSWNTNGTYAPEKAIVYNDGSWDGEDKIGDRVVCRYNSLVSPFRSFQAIWEEFSKTKGKLHDYKNFVQCWLAEFWVNDVSKTDVLILETKKRNYLRKTVPYGVKIITIGIDSQKDRFVAVARGFGDNKESWLIDYWEMPAMLGMITASEVSDILKRDVVERIFIGEDGTRWQAGLISIDTGGNRTKEIYEAVDGLERFIKIKGAGDAQKVTITHNDQIDLYLVRTAEYLEETELVCMTDIWHLPQDIQPDYISQFCSSRKIKKRDPKTGEDKITWQRVGLCNDARMADVHAHICLDIPTDRGVFRAELNKPDFSFNPVAQRIKKLKQLVAEQPEVEEEQEYDIPDFDW
jgi:phage terminase large subunit GpA-like protein